MPLIPTLVLAAGLQSAGAGGQVPPPAIPVETYRERRERVIKGLDGCMTVIAAHGETSGITEDFRQDGDFLWLTGVNEPGAWLVLAPHDEFERTLLFLKPRDPEKERWTGPRAPISPELRAQYGVDYVRRGAPDDALVEAAARHDCVAIISPAGLEKDERDDAELAQRLAGRFGLRVVYKRTLLAQLRVAHDAPEIARMERAIAITRAGHEAAARATVAGHSEREVQTQIEYAFNNAGGTGLAYPSIVGSGPNGAVLHWDDASRVLRDGDLVVVDAAAEYGRYAADVTRTFPVSGHFDAEQAAVYRAVYQAQEDIMAAVRPGVTMAQLQEVAEQSLRRSGHLKDFIHHFGHYIGLDVHDAGDYFAPLPEGAIITVEPGIYLPERGFGVRIEDEVLVTAKGCRLLTADFPRKLEDVEAWVAAARRPVAAHPVK